MSDNESIAFVPRRIHQLKLFLQDELAESPENQCGDYYPGHGSQDCQDASPNLFSHPEPNRPGSDHTQRHPKEEDRRDPEEKKGNIWQGPKKKTKYKLLVIPAVKR